MSILEPTLHRRQQAGDRLTPAPSGGPGAPAVVAFYLPQYHAIPENDAWWGEGFTDWVNVAAARPLYPSHALPSTPTDLGMYDLRSRETRAAQAKLARDHGLYGFCYYFYWFGGRRLLEQPLQLMLRDKEPDLPFCICWANEPWSRRWDGREGDVLMAQTHDSVRDLAILDDLMPFFEDPRYIRIDGRPLFLVYRQSLLDRAPVFAADLRAEAVRRGLPGLYLCNVLSIGDVDRRAEGFDAAVEFPPHGTLGLEVAPRLLGADEAFRGKIYDYASAVRCVLARPTPSFAHFPGAMPRWDNTARKRDAAYVFHGSTPELFERWLRRAALVTHRLNPDAPIVFVNSWNEWAEGAHLEPDQRTGRSYLEAVRRVTSGTDTAGDAVTEQSPTRITETFDVSAIRPGPHLEAVPLRPGLPGAISSWAVGDGSAWIEEVGGRPLEGYVIHVRPGEDVRLRGWSYHRPRQVVGHGPRDYIVVSSPGSIWHAPLPGRERRTDLLRGVLGTSQRRRKLIRALDRLPGTFEARVLSIWAARRDRLGFDVSLRSDDLPEGDWDIFLAEATRSGLVVVPTPFVLQCAR